MGYVNLPTLDVDFLKPRRMSFDTKGGGLEGGRNGLGESVTIETTGGGALIGSYQDCVVSKPEEHEYLNHIAARMNGSFRFINVPILSDWMGPFPLDASGAPQPVVGGIPHSDGALFSDDSGYSQATVFGTVAAAAALNAGQITINIVPSAGAYVAAVEEPKIDRIFRQHLGLEADIEIRYVDSIPRTPAGKARFIINEVAGG